MWQNVTHAELITVEVTNPLGGEIPAQFGLNGKTALVEMARASGIELLAPNERNPLLTTTYGTGELILAAIEHGATEILIGVGGSATVDGGAGCLQALGARLLDVHGREIPFGGGNLEQLAHIDATSLHARLAGVQLKVLCDVDNPLVGERGSAPIFAPQKGAMPAMVEQLAANLHHFASIVERDLGVAIADMPSGGAAGGLSGGLYGIAGAQLVSGVETLLDVCGYRERFAQGDIDLVITGEGQLDSQTGAGKAPLGIAQLARQHGIPVIALVGSFRASPDDLAGWGITSAFSILPHIATLEEALANGENWLRETATQIGNLLALSM